MKITKRQIKKVIKEVIEESLLVEEAVKDDGKASKEIRALGNTQDRLADQYQAFIIHAQELYGLDSLKSDLYDPGEAKDAYDENDYVLTFNLEFIDAESAEQGEDELNDTFSKTPGYTSYVTDDFLLVQFYPR